MVTIARCGCANDQCSCNFVAGDGINIAGSGSRSNPYVVEVIPVEDGEEEVSSRFSGEIVAYGGASAPVGWLTCDGAAVSRTVYSALYAVLGTTYGAGNGSTTFNLPNLSGKFPMGAGAHARGSTGGSETTTIAQANLPAHEHSNDHNHAAFTTAKGGIHEHEALGNDTAGSNVGVYTYGALSGRTNDDGALIAGARSDHDHVIDVPNYTGLTGPGNGGGTPATTVSPFLSVNYIVKY